ncbi:MAG: hypothetical protein V4544_01030 [Pseudomonadota bacterium]
MKNTLRIIGMISLTALTGCNTANNTASLANKENKTSLVNSDTETFDVRNVINNRFKQAAKAFNGNETGELKVINGGRNGELSDSPAGDDSFKKPTNDTSEMICYKSDTGKIVAADSPNKLGTEYKKDIAASINAALKTDIDGKVVVYRTALRPDFTDATKQISKKMMTVAWSGMALTGNKNSKLVCTISASAPEA